MILNLVWLIEEEALPPESLSYIQKGISTRSAAPCDGLYPKLMFGSRSYLEVPDSAFTIIFDRQVGIPYLWSLNHEQCCLLDSSNTILLKLFQPLKQVHTFDLIY
jgi:hypothetical protein